MDLCGFIQSIADVLLVLLGALISGLVTYCYYKKAAEDLIKESNLLRKETAEIQKSFSVLLTFISNNQNLFDLTSEIARKKDGSFGVNVTIKAPSAD